MKGNLVYESNTSTGADLRSPTPSIAYRTCPRATPGQSVTALFCELDNDAAVALDRRFYEHGTVLELTVADVVVLQQPALNVALARSSSIKRASAHQWQD